MQWVFYGQSTRTVLLAFTEEYRNGEPLDYTVPDFSDVPGFDVTWGLLAQSVDVVLIEFAFYGPWPGILSTPAGVGGLAAAAAPNVLRGDGPLSNLSAPLRQLSGMPATSGMPVQGGTRQLLRATTLP